MDKTRLDILAIGDGQAVLHYASTPFYPSYGKEIATPKMELEVTGSTLQFVVVSSRLGLKMSLITKLGEDYFGRMVLERLRTTTIDLSQIKISAYEKTSVSTVLVHDSGKWLAITYIGANETISPDDVGESYRKYIKERRPKIFHIGAYFKFPLLMGKPFMTMLEFARQNQALTSLDLIWDPFGWTDERIETLCKTLCHVDIFLPNLNEAKMITGCNRVEDAVDKLLKLGPRIIAMKMGKKGCIIATSNEIIKVPAFKIKPLDTVGAGDAFAAGFLYGIVKGFSLQESAIIGNAMGAMKSLTIGYKFHWSFTIEQVNAFLQKNGINIKI
jgi:sugar/nucleoside kinase (ribokinase family)